MAPLLATIVDGGALLKLVLAALIAGVGATTLYGIAIYGVARSVELRRSGRAAGATALGALGLLAALAFLAIIAYGIALLAGTR